MILINNVKKEEYGIEFQYIKTKTSGLFFYFD